MILTIPDETAELDPQAIAELEADLDKLAAMPLAALDFHYDTSIDSPNHNSDGGRGPDSITLHWWGSPSLHRTGVGAGVARYLSTRAAQASAHYVATVQAADRAEIVYQIIADADNAWHSGSNAGNATSLGIEMMPFDAQTPDWQVDALIRVAAQLVASLWHRWPHLKDQPLRGHQYWVETACPGNYQPRLHEILTLAQYWYPRHISFGQFDETPDPQPAPQEDTIMYVISCPGRGIALVGPGHFAPCTDNTDVHTAIRLSGGRVLETADPAEWDRWRRLMIGESAIAALRDSDVQKMVDAVKGVSAAEVAKQLEVTVKK